MPHQVARWRHLAIKDKALLLCEKDLVREPCYKVHTESVPGVETVKVIKGSYIKIECADSKYSAEDYIKNINILYTTAVAGYTVWVIFYADILYREDVWVRKLCGVAKMYNRVGDALIGDYFTVNTYPPGSGSWIRPKGGFIVDCDAGLEIVKTGGGTKEVFTAVDDDDNY